MSQLIHQAQIVKTIVSDASLPAGKRSHVALRAFQKIELERFDDEAWARLHADDDPAAGAIEASNAALDQFDELIEGERFDECEARLVAFGSHDPRLLEALDSVASRIIEAELDRIVAELDVAFDVLPEGAIREAREHRDLIVPRLIKVLQDAIDAALAGEIPDGHAHFFAVFLLTEFQAREAFPVMLKAFSLADDLSSDLFGDAIHEVPRRMLALFSGDQPEAIEALIDDHTLNMYFRWQAANSFLYLVHEGRISRDEAVRRLQRCLRRAIDDNIEEITGPLISEMLHYAPEEALADIREAFERGLVEEFLVQMRDVEQSVADGPSRLEDALKRDDPVTIDTLEHLKTWASFQPKAPRPAGTISPLSPRELGLPAPHFETDEESYSPKSQPVVARGPRTGRNDPCPCGSGKKFKKCCGARA